MPFDFSRPMLNGLFVLATISSAIDRTINHGLLDISVIISSGILKDSGDCLLLGANCGDSAIGSKVVYTFEAHVDDSIEGEIFPLFTLDLDRLNVGDRSDPQLGSVGGTCFSFQSVSIASAVWLACLKDPSIQMSAG